MLSHTIGCIVLAESDLFIGYASTAYSLAAIIIAISALHLLVLVSVLCRKRADLKEVFHPVIEKFDNYLQVMVFIMAIIFSLLTIVNTATDGCCGVWTWHVGLFAIILGWTYLIHLSSKLPFVGEQAIMFLDILWTFLKLSIFALLLVLAATIVLAMTFFNPQAQVG